jgi:hypothetical protein
MEKIDYDDDYPTCVETYSTLRIFGDKISPVEITKILKIKPTRSFQKGEPFSKKRLVRKTNSWFLCTEKSVKSRDTRRHIDFILRVVEKKTSAVKLLKRKGCKLDIVSYFVSIGQGGPMLSPHQMLKLGKLDVGIGWDIYFQEESRKTK